MLRLDLVNTQKQQFSPSDFYITKHSNLASFHVVFHLVCERDLSSSSLTSKSPIFAGLRNILAASATYDISTITIPLLLAYTLTPEMNDKWCIRRAELVLKCVKGFMMEASTFGEGDERTIQFLVPDNVSPSLFSSFSHLVSNIFKLSTPLVVRKWAKEREREREK